MARDDEKGVLGITVIPPKPYDSSLRSPQKEWTYIS